MKNKIFFRENLKAGDEKAIEQLLESTGFFYDFEIITAIELIEERRKKGTDSGYFFLFAEKNNQIAAYTCFGPIACTRSSYDLFWIATKNTFRGQGLGSQVLYETCKIINKMGGQTLYAETSGRDLYKPTHEFYYKTGFTLEASLKNFYDIGDDKLIFKKQIPLQ